MLLPGMKKHEQPIDKSSEQGVLCVLPDRQILKRASRGGSPPQYSNECCTWQDLVIIVNVQKTSRLVTDNDTACESVFVVVVLLVAGVQLY